MVVLAGLAMLAVSIVAAPAAGTDVEAATSPPPDQGVIQAFGTAERFPVPTFEQVLEPVDITAEPSSDGYWRTDALGRVEASGGAVHVGSTFGIALVDPVVAMAATPTGLGYWLAAADGGVFAFGDAAFFGSMGGIPLVSPVMGFAATADGAGYWMAARDGGLFAFGSAPFVGSDTGRPAGPRTAFAADDVGAGYWMSTASVFGPVGLFDTARPVIVVDPTQPTLTFDAGTTVQTTGELADLGGSRWVEIETPDAGLRLIRYDDLVPTPGIAPDAASLPCDGGDEPASFPTPTLDPPPATGGPTPALVYGVDHQVLPDGCERVTVVFGVDGPDGRETIADVPAGVSFSSQGTNASLYFPFIEPQRPVISVQTGRAGDRARLFTVVRLRDPAGSLEQSLVVHADRARRIEATFLSDPARVVIDLGIESAAPGADEAPRFGPAGSIESNGSPIVVVTQLLGPGGVLAIEGIGRPFEAGIDVRLRTAAPVPGGGAPVVATFTGGVGGTRTTSEGYGVTATDWIDAWGEFAFGIEPLPVGDYELFVGELSPADGSEQGAYITFSID